MTRAEAQQELNSLEPLEAAAWSEVTTIDARYSFELRRLEVERQSIKDQCDAHSATARAVWLPLCKRKAQLKAFLEISM